MAAALAVAAVMAGCGSRTATSALSRIKVLPQKAALVRMHMESAEKGWAMANAGRLLYTADGGGTWHPLVLPGGYGKAVAWAFRGAKGWLAVDRYSKIYTFATSSEAMAWHRRGTIDVPAHYRGGGVNMGFSDARHGWLTVAAPGMQFEGAILFKTDNGGLNWHGLASRYRDRPAHLPVGSLPGNILGFADSSTGWAVSNMASSANPPKEALLVTHDGGRTWSHTYIPIPMAYRTATIEYMGLQAFDSRDIAMFVRYLLTKDQIFVVYTTTNQGESWKASRPLSVTPASGDIVYDFLSGKEGWVVDNGNAAEHTTKFIYSLRNGHWHQISPDINLADKFVTDIDFISGNEGWMVGWIHAKNSGVHGFMAESTNGGVDWTAPE